ncbi:MAG TPA: cytochrome c peroxidase [Gemmataceae bacterium]|nr:cytochrome c peroxidase [Gemmataceae bacterium]
MRLRQFAAPMLLTALLSGCQRAEHYGPRGAAEPPAKTQLSSDTPKKANSATPLDPDIQWIDVFDPPKPDMLIDFVHAEQAPEEWAKLPHFWNAPALTKPAQAAALIGLPPLTAGSVAGSDPSSIIKIKVPLGLSDPRSYIPAGNPLTLGKWKLGQRLFFDDSWLEAKAGTSCATCHRPDHGFADREPHHRNGFNTPTLVNCVFNSSQFWDGRASRLEEVVQQTLEDERASDPPKPFRHAWSGVIQRLRNKVNYHEQFNEVFGTPTDGKDGKERANITQDTVSRALATYLRTILAGDSIHDRAVREQRRKHSPTLKAEHYETVLDDATLKALKQEKAKKADVAAELTRGYLLFSKLDERRPLMNCVDCHSGRNFTDKEFHNLGVGSTSRPGEEAGRFAQTPIGRKNRYLIDAYKTPTLRNLPRTGPYFHNGQVSSLRQVVEFYNLGARRNEYLDPKLLSEGGRTRQLGLNTADIDALVLFLNALGGNDVDDVVKKPLSSGK